jgi:replicative DNA helicase
MTHLETVWRFGCLASGVSFRDLRQGQLSTAETRAFKEATIEEGYHGIIRVEGRPTVAEIEAWADQRDADSVLVDQLSHLESRGNYRSDWEKMSEIVYDLADMAKRTGFERPVYVACQLNREAEGKDPKQVLSSMLARTGAIEQACDTCFGIVRTQEMEEQRRAQLVTVVGRSVGKDEWDFVYDFEKKTQIGIGLRGTLPKGDGTPTLAKKKEEAVPA